PGHARLAWNVTEAAQVNVYRRHASEAWTRVAVSDVVENLATYDDATVSPGERYGYRLGWPAEHGETFAGEVWVDVPRTFEFALHGVRPNPSMKTMAVA